MVKVDVNTSVDGENDFVAWKFLTRAMLYV